MLNIVFSDKFVKAAKRLPISIQSNLAEKLEKLQNNPFNSLLHTKYLVGKLSGFYSFRITRDWRVIFYFINTEIIKLIDVAHRKDIYR